MAEKRKSNIYVEHSKRSLFLKFRENLLYKKIDKFMVLLKFILIWWISALTDLLFLYILTDIFWLHYLLSACISFNIVLLCAFFVHKKYTFSCDRTDVGRQYLSFFLINIITFGVYSALLFWWVEYLWFHYLVTAVLAKIFVFLCNFTANKYITFKKYVP